MNQRQAQWGFIVLNILAIPAVFYPLYETYRIYTEANAGHPLITYQSSDFYFLLMSVFWVMWAIQYIGLKGNKSWVEKYAQPLLIGWFIGSIVVAFLAPVGIDNGLHRAGYYRCEPTDDHPTKPDAADRYFSLSKCNS
jgi:hypothetical protein